MAGFSLHLTDLDHHLAEWTASQVLVCLARLFERVHVVDYRTDMVNIEGAALVAIGTLVLQMENRPGRQENPTGKSLNSETAER